MTDRIDLGRRGMLAAGLAALTAPGWLAAAFAAEGGPTPREKELFQAWHSARRAGTSLLVVVVPADDDKWERGRNIGATLNNASDALLAVLSRYQPACATLEELRKLGVRVEGSPWFVLVEAGELPRAGVPIAGPPTPEVKEDPDEVQFGGPSDAMIDAWIAAIDAELVAALGPVPEGATAIAAGKARWVPERLPGSYWAQSGGCGVSIEDYEDNVRYGCGMGHVPTKARRMLYFFEPGTS